MVLADSTDPGLVTQRLWLRWVKLWSKNWEEIGAGKPRLYLPIFSDILYLSGFPLHSLKKLSANSERSEGTEEDYSLVKLLP